MDIDKKKREFATCKEGFIPDIGWLVNYGNTSFNDITKMMLKDMDSRMKKIAKERAKARSTQLQKSMEIFKKINL